MWRTHFACSRPQSWDAWCTVFSLRLELPHSLAPGDVLSPRALTEERESASPLIPDEVIGKSTRLRSDHGHSPSFAADGGQAAFRSAKIRSDKPG